ncbi:MAG: hypothetical protein COS94_01695 [Candidatus Hydrogenedentes bacterium CG07_land_8_20_14_0_80_42_17]|nr:MAG: hypothetical protein COS94_01695 [Candidatus Hydrogenedentes bacterium CG07_land_8_20_14_0_80_42_17]
MADKVVEVTQKGYFSRIGNSFKGIVFGLILFVVSIGLLFWNEGRAVKTAKTLKEGKTAVISVPVEPINGANDDRLIHTIGMANTDEILIDPEFELSRNALRFRRDVEMYQWEEDKKTEERKKLGGGTEEITTYEYKKVWSSSLINSSDFKEISGHDNPNSIQFKSQTWNAGKGTLGAFSLTSELIEKIDSFRNASLSDSDYETFMKANTGKKVNRIENGYYIGADQSAPAIGDMRVRFTEVVPQSVSIIGKQFGGTFTAYQTSAGGSILMIEPGIKTADEMFASAEKQNSMMTWILRGVGFILAWIGLSMIFAPLSVIADVVPFIGTIVGAGTSIISFIIALPISLITIAVAWLFFRPVLAIMLLILAGAIIGAGIFWAFKKGAASKIAS